MASEVISHAIFASFHLTSPRTALSSTPPSTPPSPPTPYFAPHLAPRFTPHPSLHSHPASRLSCTPHPALHSSPYSAQPCTPTLHPIMRFTQHLDPHSHPYPSAKSFLPPIVKLLPPSHSIFLPSTNFPSTSLYPPCPSAKPLHPVLHPASHHALHPAHRPHSTPPISIALLCSPGFP